MFPILAPMKVDKHIRRLDSDLSRFEQELKLKEPGLRRTSISSIAEMAPPTLPSSKSRDFLIIGNFQKYWKLSNSVPLFLLYGSLSFEIILCSIYANVKFNCAYVHILYVSVQRAGSGVPQMRSVED